MPLSFGGRAAAIGLPPAKRVGMTPRRQMLVPKGRAMARRRPPVDRLSDTCVSSWGGPSTNAPAVALMDVGAAGGRKPSSSVINADQSTEAKEAPCAN